MTGVPQTPERPRLQDSELGGRGDEERDGTELLGSAAGSPLP